MTAQEENLHAGRKREPMIFLEWSNRTQPEHLSMRCVKFIDKILSTDHEVTKLEVATPLGLNQMCSKFCPKCFQEFPKIFTHYALQCSYYAATSVTIIMEHFNQ